MYCIVLKVCWCLHVNKNLLDYVVHTSSVLTVCVFVVLEGLTVANKSSPSSSLSNMEEKGSLLVVVAGLVVSVDY